MTRVSVFVAALLLTASLTMGQTLTTGDVAGVVKDPTGAVVPGAVVTLKSTDTGETRTVVSNSTGQYRFSLLKPGDFTISATSTSLKSSPAKFTAMVGQEQEVDITLKVQGTEQTVEVRADVAVLQTENANLATGFDTKQIVDLPMPGGDLTTLAMTTPGVRVNVHGGSGNMNANGIAGSSVLFTLNGSDEMDPYNNLNNSGASNNLLGANEVAEGAVVLNAYSPQYGHMAGGQVNLIGKSGTNSYHGNAFYNYNAEFLNANDFFANSTGTPRTRSDAHQFGASFGGPVIKNKTFVFADYEALRYVLPATGVGSVPSPQLETYALAHVGAAALPLYKDMFGLINAAPGINRALAVTNGPGPLQDRNNHMGCGTQGFSGTPTGTGGTFGVDTPCALAFDTSNTQLNKEGLVTVRVDQNISDKQKIFFRWNYDFGLQATGTSPIAPVFNSISKQPQDTGSFNHTYVITPSLVNNVIGSAFWYSAIFGVADFSKTTSLMPESMSVSDGGANNGGFLGVGAGLPTGRDIGHAELIDDLAWTHGRHTIKAGTSIRYDKVTYTSIASSTVKGSYSFADLQDFTTGQINNAAFGSLGGSFTQAFTPYGAVHFRDWGLGFYASDEWAATKSLKLTFGMRFEQDRDPTCIENCFSLFNVPFVNSSYQGGASVPYSSTIEPSLHNAYYNIEKLIPEPRFGFTWSPFGNSKTVIRGGIGQFSTVFAASSAGTFASQAPNKFTPSVTFGLVGMPTDAGSSANIAYASNQIFQTAFKNGSTLGQIKTALAPIPFGLPSFTSIPTNYAAPKTTEWSFGVEQQLGARNVLAVNYDGNHSYDIQESVNANMFTGSTGISRYGGGFAGLPTAAPDARFNSVTQVYTNGLGNFDSLTVQLRHSFSYGLTGQIHYTWSHALGTVGYENPFSIAAGYGNLGFDTRHQIAADLVWSQPHQFGNKVVNRLARGWTLGAKMYIYSGSPFSVTDSKIPAQVNSAGGVITPLADVIGSIPTSCGKSAVNAPCYSRTSFATYASNSGVASPIQTDWGNLAPNQIYGPGYFDIDATLNRDFRVTEHATLTFGLNSYNLLNHPNFMNPSGCVSSASCGLITGTVTPPTSIYGSFQAGTVSGRVLVVSGRVTF
ncbi:MAG TPA: carboxypeptidase-like regulatory domain-containing protein [Bryobacteraceae bacterium]|nr:carboxypeptidase-like regulatory domain-containing protein [Bryobacteraceae bacterium]